MKLRKLLLGAALLFSCVAFSQTNAAKINPLGLVAGVVNGGYERAINDTQSAGVYASYLNISGVKGFGLSAEYRFYFDDEALKGWHAGPSLGFLSLEDNVKTKASAFLVGGEAGHQWIFDSGFLVDAFASFSYVGGADSLQGFSGSVIGIGASIGYAW